MLRPSRHGRAFLVIIIVIIALQIPTARCQHARRTASHRSSKPTKTRQDPGQRNDDDDFDHQRRKWENNEFQKNRHRVQHEETATAIAKILRKTKPRGLIHGIWKASQSTTLGFLIGMTCLITFPSTSLFLVGFKMKPMLLATILGSIMGFSAVAIGILNGLYNCYWGLVQMPKSIQSWWKGSVWNPYDGGSWQMYDLSEHQQELMREQLASSNNGNKPSYYQILEVPATANKSEIKRAYYVKAKELHPDKNQLQGEEAEEAFLQLQKAYQTLSDDSQRSLYDELGHSSSSSPSQEKMTSMMFHPNLFFSILFDSNSLQPFVGNLAVSSWALQLIQLGLFANESDQDPHENARKLIVMVADLQRKEQKRQVDVAIHLLDTIESFSSSGTKLSDDLAFRQYCRQHAKAILEKSFFQDSRLLQLVGERLELSARKWEGRPFGLVQRGWLWSKSSVGLLSHRLEFYKGIFGLLQYLLKYMEPIRQGDFSFMEAQHEEDAFASETAAEMVPKLWNLFWHYTTLDVQATIDGASWKLFSDSGSNRMEQSKRAKALRIMGQEFAKVAKENSVGMREPLSNHFLEEEYEAEIATGKEEEKNPSFSLIQDPAIRLEVAMAVARDQAGDNPIKLRKKVHSYLKQREKKKPKQ